jgi:hypothetical protein
MDPIALRPRKATEIVDAAIEVYRRNPIHFLLLAAIVQVPWLIVQILWLAPRDGRPEAAVGIILVSFGKVITTLLTSGFVIHMASEVYLGRETDAFATIRAASSRIPAVFFASLLQTVALIFAFFLFIFPIIWVSALLFAVLPLVVIERRGPFKAFDRSSQLSAGVKGHILSALGLVAIIWFIVNVGGVIIVSIITNPELRYVAAAVVEMILYPVFGITSTLIYYDVRIRKEGFDIEMMAQAPVAAAPAPSAV